MEIEVSWLTVLKVVAAGAFTYVVLPVLLVLRDALLWKVVDIFILNKKLSEKIMEYASESWVLDNRYSKVPTSFIRGSDTVYLMGDDPVSEEMFNTYRKERERRVEIVEGLSLYIDRRSNLLNWLIRHYKQDGASNPIPKWKENVRLGPDQQVT